MMEENIASLHVNLQPDAHLLVITPDNVYTAEHGIRKLYCCQWTGGGSLTVRVLHPSNPIVAKNPQQ